MYHLLTRNLGKKERDELDAALHRRPEDVDPDTGLAPPAWWKGEDDAAMSAVSFLSQLKR